MQITVTQFQGGVDAQAADPTLVQTSGIPTLGDSTVDVYITYDVITL